MKLLALWLALAFPAQEALELEPEFEPIFDGLTLDGWVQRGGDAHYEVRDGAIVGNAVAGGPNSFLCTERSFADFELELEFLVRGNLNSGVQIRSHARSAARNAVVYGYQIEIDPSPRAWTGGLYEESGRGWLDDSEDDEVAREAFRAGEWNHMRVLALGSHLRTWINGVPVTDYLDTRSLEGFIALQVHGVPEVGDGLSVSWRSLRLRDLGSHSWQALWNGQDLTGWAPVGGGQWFVEGERLVGTSPATQESHGILLSESRFDDFTARLSWRIVQGNSGFYFRCEPVENDPLIVHGLQAEIDGGEKAGGLYETGGREWIVQPDPALVAEHYLAEDWNETIVYALGSRLAVDFNGWRSAELTKDPGRREGHFGLQLHGGQAMRLELRSIEVLLPVAR